MRELDEPGTDHAMIIAVAWGDLMQKTEIPCLVDMVEHRK